MLETKFKTLRHMETVRNYLNAVILNLLGRGENHDQCKLQSPEIEIFNEYTPKLRKSTYGSEEYKTFLQEMNVALKHHYEISSHHPEHHSDGINDMNLLDLIEMLCDWKAATLRHNTGDIYKSLEINRERFNISDQLYNILLNTAKVIEKMDVKHLAEES